MSRVESESERWVIAALTQYSPGNCATFAVQANDVPDKNEDNREI